MDKYYKKAFNIITNILLFILILVIIITLYGGFQKIALKKTFVNYFGYTFFEVASGSMSGTIEVNDLIVVKLNYNDIKVNDIITYQNENDFITHRVIKIDEDYIITKGDTNNSNDNPIKREDIIGKVVKVIPNYGILKKILLSPKVLLSISITIILFSFYWWLKTNNKNKEKIK